MIHFFNVLIILCVAAGLVRAQGITSSKVNMTGKILELDGTPIAGATVKLAKAGLSATTADDGSFSVVSTAGLFGRGQVQPRFAALRNGHLEIRVSENTPVTITAFTPGGKTLYKKERFLSAGVHAISIPAGGQGIVLFKVTAGGQTAYLKVCSLEGNVRVTTRDRLISAGALAKTGAGPHFFADTVIVSKSGYLDYISGILNTDTSGLSLRMASADHARFTRQHLYEIGSAPFPSVHSASIVELSDGTLLSCYMGGSREGAQDAEIYMSRKQPGKDWEAPVSVGSGIVDGKKHTTGNSALFQERGGRLFLLYMAVPPGYRLGRMRHSDDGGRTWSEDRNICEKCIGPEKNKPVQLENGTILSPSADRNRNSGGGIRVEKSTDGGMTWEAMPPIKGGPEAIQPAIMFHPGGRLQMVCRGKGKIPMTWSDDNGETWSPLESTVLPGNWSGIDAVTLRDGRQLVTYNHVPSTGKGPRTFLNVAISKDGKAWSAAQVLGICSRGQFSYPAVIQSRNGLLHFVHTWHRETIEHIVVNPYKFTDSVPMPDGKWPTSGPLSKGENGDKKG